MEAPKRLFINTLAQYIKAITNLFLSLYTVRLVLSALGQSDYGIFSLIGGVIALLAFIQNAMVITTQRYLSYYFQENNKNYLRKIFSNSFLLHLCIGILLAIFVLIFRDFLCKEFLNIADERRLTASIVYIAATIMMALTFITSPFKALFIARENIVFISVIEVLDGLLKLIMAIILLQIDADKLLLYSIMMLAITIFEFIVYSIYAIIKFEECNPKTFIKDYDIKQIKQLTGFATWTTYGMGAVILRTQGLSILINKFFGTTLNASYGIALQLNGVVSFVSTSIINAMNPQIMKAEGQHDRNKMLHLAEQESKFSTALMSLLFIPLIVEMDVLLKMWLGSVPPYSCFFCRCLLISFLIDQSTYGLHTAMQAIGKIKYYSIIMYTPKLLILPACWALLHVGYQVESIMICYILIEFIVASLRLPYLRKLAGLNIKAFLSNVIAKLIIPILIISGASMTLKHVITIPYSFLINIPIAILLGVSIIWFVTFTNSEKEQILRIIHIKK